MSDTARYSTISTTNDDHLRLKQILLAKQTATGEKWNMVKLINYLINQELQK